MGGAYFLLSAVASDIRDPRASAKASEFRPALYNGPLEFPQKAWYPSTARRRNEHSLPRIDYLTILTCKQIDFS